MQGPTRATAFRQAVATLRRRLAVIVACIAVVPAVAYAVSHAQTARYQGAASVLVTFKDPGGDGRTNTDQVFNRDDAQRFALTQSTIARTPALAQRVIARLRLREAPTDFLDRSSVAPQGNTDLLLFQVTDARPGLAKRAAKAYAREFVTFRADLERAALQRSIADLRSGRARLRGGDRSARARALRDRERTLRLLAALPAGGAYYVSTSASAPQVAPRTTRDVALGAALGLLLALGLALLLEAVDTRVRRGAEISDALGIPVLGRLPRPSRRAGRAGAQPVVLAAPDTPDAEAVRMLRAGLALATRDGAARSILVCSALAGEGKTTTTANLAAALASAGRHVIAVDLDLRSPALGPMLGAAKKGISDVVRGRVALDDALHAVPLRDSGSADGRLEVLGTGTPPADPGDFVGTPAVAEILAQLRERADVVLVDCPPWLQVGDGLALSARVDAVLVVARVGGVKEGTIADLRKLLDAAPVPALGVVLTDAAAEDRAGTPYGYYLLADEPWARPDATRGTAGSPRP